KTFGKCEVLAADQQESKLRLAQLFVELCVPTSSDIDLIDILRLRADAVIEGLNLWQTKRTPMPCSLPRASIASTATTAHPGDDKMLPRVLRTSAFARSSPNSA